MNKSNLINQEADLVQLENRFKVTVEFIITADDMDEAIINHMKRTYNLLIGERSADGTTWEVQMTTASNVDIRFGSFASTENGDFGWAIGKYGFIASYKKTHTKVDRQQNRTLPVNFSLYQNYPNPFNPTTEIRFSVSKQTHVSLEIYNLMGQKIATLMDAKKYPGRYAISWDGKNRNGCAVSSGVYFYRLQAGDFNATMKMLLIR